MAGLRVILLLGCLVAGNLEVEATTLRGRIIDDSDGKPTPSNNQAV